MRLLLPFLLAMLVRVRLQVLEPMLILGKEKFAGVDIRIRVRGGGHTSQVYAIRQALCKVF